jgi:hypothetical protein
MAIEFKWVVDKVQVDQDNVIVKVYLTVTCTNGDNVIANAHIRNLTRSGDIAPFDQLTEQQVLDWCFAPETITWVSSDNVQQTIIKNLKNDGELQIAEQMKWQLLQKSTEPVLPWVSLIKS